MMKQTSILLSALSIMALIAATACEDDSEAIIRPEIQLDSTQNLAMVSMASTEDTFYVECTDAIKLYQVDGDQKNRLGKGGIDVNDQWKGYFADNRLVPPIADEGCDILSCESFAGFSRDYSLLRYELVGQRELTDADKETFSGFYGGTITGEIPDTLSEYVSNPVHGDVEVEVTYLNSCDDFSSDESARLSYTEVITVP